MRGPNLVIEACNPRFTRLFGSRVVQGRPLDEIFDVFWEAGRSIISLAREVYYHDAARTIPRMLIRFPQQQSEPVESYFMYTIVPTHDATGRVSGIVIYATGKTEQRAREIEEERARLRLIFDHANAAAMTLFDVQTTALVMASPRYVEIAARLHGLEESSVIGRKWHELYPPSFSEPVDTSWNTALESHAPFHLSEARIKLPEIEQETIWDWTLTSIPNGKQDGPVHFMLVSAIEITEQARAREEVERLNELRDEFLARASHELRTPLTAILGNAELLQLYLTHQETASVNDAGQHFAQDLQTVDRMIHQIQRLNKLIDDMLDITRLRNDVLQLDKQQNVNIVELALGVVEQYRSATSRQISLETKQPAIAGTWDEDRLEQVLNNLVSNAIHYSPANTPVNVSIANQADEVIVSVRNQGQGISEKDQTHIFDRFYRVHNEETLNVDGLGLGLYIASKLITQHGGRMWLESNLFKGSVFSFSLPLEK